VQDATTRTTPSARERTRSIIDPASLPNIITLGRAVLVPVVFWLVLTGRTQAAFLVFLLAGVSDAIDGWLAKRFHWQSKLGAYLDPLADKLLIVSIFVALGALGELPLWIVVAVVSRDILIVLGVVLTWLLAVPMRIQPSAVSKANTAAQIVLAGLVLADEGFNLGLDMVRIWLVWLTLALTLASLALYARTWLTHMGQYDVGGGGPVM
jgi:cardiolipin synthase